MNSSDVPQDRAGRGYREIAPGRKTRAGALARPTAGYNSRLANPELRGRHGVQEGLIETCDTYEEADRARARWAAEIVKAGLAGRYGIAVRFVRLSHRNACYGVFADPIPPPADRAAS